MTTVSAARRPTASIGVRLWSRWVGANGVAEAVGLGASAAVAVAVAGMGDSQVPGALVASAAALLLAGAFEGMVVGHAQHRVLTRPLPTLRRRPWVAATVVGAVLAWGVGLVPSTVAGFGDGGPPVEGAAQLVLAATMGLVVGPVLGVPQWRVLRRHVRRAGWWVPANALAWAAALPVVFVAAGSVPAGASAVSVAALVVLACAGAGLVAGAVHGAVLIALLRRQPA